MFAQASHVHEYLKTFLKSLSLFICLLITSLSHVTKHLRTFMVSLHSRCERNYFSHLIALPHTFPKSSLPEGLAELLNAMISAKASLDVPHSTSCVTHVEWRIWTQVHAFASTDPQAHPLRPRTTSMQLINIDNKWFETQLNIIQITLRVGKTDVLVPKKFHAECLVIFVKIFHLLSDLHDHVKFGNDMWRRILKSNTSFCYISIYIDFTDLPDTL